MQRTIIFSAACALLTLSARCAAAAPAVTSLTGDFVAGGSVTISGSSFGAKAMAAPKKWDDFEGGVAGQPLSGWSLDSNAGASAYPAYSAVRARVGALAGMANFESAYNSTAFIEGLNQTELYLSYWVYVDHLSGVPSRNVKLARVTAGVPSYNSGEPSLGHTSFYSNGASIWYSFTGTNDSQNQTWDEAIPAGAWHRIEMYGKLSDVGVANGARGFWLNHEAIEDDASYTTLTSDSHGSTYDTLVLPFYVAHDDGGPHRIYYDDVYMDSSRARVEIGNAPTWAASTRRELQIPTAWSDGEITVSANAATWDGPAYLYVVDGNGQVNAAGYPISVVPEPSTAGMLGCAAAIGWACRKRTRELP